MPISSTVKWPWPKPVTPRAEKVLTTLAQEQARKFGSAEILPEHFLLAMLAEGTGLGCRILTSLKVHAGLNVEQEELRSLLESALPGPEGPTVTGEIPISKRGERLLELTAEAAENMLDATRIGTEQILMGAAVEPGSVVDRYFTRTGAHDMIMFALVCADGENAGVAGPSESAASRFDDSGRGLSPRRAQLGMRTPRRPWGGPPGGMIQVKPASQMSLTGTARLSPEAAAAERRGVDDALIDNPGRVMPKATQDESFASHPREALLLYGYAVQIIAAADGRLTRDERELLFDDGRRLGVAPDIIEDWVRYNWRNETVASILERARPHMTPRLARRVLYGAIRIALADDVYAIDERAAIDEAADLLGVTPDQLEALGALVRMEMGLAVLRKGLLLD